MVCTVETLKIYFSHSLYISATALVEFIYGRNILATKSKAYYPLQRTTTSEKKNVTHVGELHKNRIA